MKFKTEAERIYGTHWDIDTLINELTALRTKAGANVGVEIIGSLAFGYGMVCRWKRPLTAEEIEFEARSEQRAEEAAKNDRRKRYELLKEEFEK